MLKLKLQYFGHEMRRTDSLKKTLMLGKIEGGRSRKPWEHHEAAAPARRTVHVEDLCEMKGRALLLGSAPPVTPQGQATKQKVPKPELGARGAQRTEG